MSAHRPLAPSEKYFAFADPVAPMNLLNVAELDVVLPAEQVARGWSDHFAHHAPARLQVHADLTMSDAGAVTPEFRSVEAPAADWDAQLAEFSASPFGLDRPAVCLYFASPAEGRSRLVVACHHAVADGRGGARDLQLLIRRIDGQDVPDHGDMLEPPPQRALHPWEADRREYLRLLRAIKERQGAAGELTPAVWDHQLHDPAAARVQSLILEPDVVSALAARAKTAGARVFGAIGAGWLTAVHRVVYPRSAEITVQLSSPIDLRDPADVGPATAGNVSILANRYRVGTSPFWELARTIQQDTARSVAAGEGQLFLELTGARRIDDLADGSREVQRQLLSTPPSVASSNFGVIDPGTDPPWVHSICGYLTTTPNHVVFVSGAGYRGRIGQSITTNDRQLDPGLARAVIDAFVQIVGAATREP